MSATTILRRSVRSASPDHSVEARANPTSSTTKVERAKTNRKFLNRGKMKSNIPEYAMPWRSKR